jgi:hypothetical protein
MCADARACRGGQSPVWVASRGGHVSCVEALIGAKSDVLQCNSRLGCGNEGEREGAVVACVLMRACRDGQSPMFVACAGGHVSCVEALIGAKADVLQCNS